MHQNHKWKPLFMIHSTSVSPQIKKKRLGPCLSMMNQVRIEKSATRTKSFTHLDTYQNRNNLYPNQPTYSVQPMQNKNIRKKWSKEDCKEIFHMFVYAINTPSGKMLFNDLVWFGLVLWHIKHFRLFNAKFSLYIYIKYMWFNKTFCWSRF